MDDLDEEVPELIPVDDYEAIAGSATPDGRDRVFEPPKRLEKTVPVTLITGFLGAGKTTLVNYILSENHGFRIAVILNEIGDQRGIEKALLQDESGGKQRVDEWVELTNGCLCCSVKDDFVNALESLMLQQSVFDYILIETTGLANPGPVAAALWTDEELEAGVVLDCIVTVVDAKHIRRQLTGNAAMPHAISPATGSAHTPPPASRPPDASSIGHTNPATLPASSTRGEVSRSDAVVGTNAAARQEDEAAAVQEGAAAAGVLDDTAAGAADTPTAPAINEAQQQVAYADVILLNKTDLVSAAELQEVKGSLLRHNAAAEVVECRDSRIDLRRILDRGSYKRAALEAAQVSLPEVQAGQHHGGGGHPAGAPCAHPGCGAEDGACDHTHDHHERGGHMHGEAGAAAPLSHDPDVTTVTLRIEEPVSLEGVKVWMDTLLWESAAVVDIFRVKGLLCVAGSDCKHGLQAVHELYDVAEGPPWTEGEERCTRIVVIGRRLSHTQLLQSLRRACLPA